MHPTTSEPSSEPAQDAIVAVSETSSEQAEQPSRGTSFFQRLWRGRNGRFISASEDGQVEEAPEAQPPSAITLTQEELDRRVQSETDRREYKRQQEAAAERKRKLRDEDPWAYAEEDRQAERNAQVDQQTTQWLGNLGSTHDRFTLDPLVESLPETERNRILGIDGAGIGLDGRKLIVNESLKALEKHWRAEGARDAEDKLRRNSAFRKQILSEFRRGMSEPEFIGSGNASSGDGQRVSDMLRDQLGLHRSA